MKAKMRAPLLIFNKWNKWSAIAKKVEPIAGTNGLIFFRFFLRLHIWLQAPLNILKVEPKVPRLTCYNIYFYELGSTFPLLNYNNNNNNNI